METLRPHNAPAALPVDQWNMRAFLEWVSNTAFQVNILSLLIAASMAVGWSLGLFINDSHWDNILLLFAAAGLIAACLLNTRRMYELSSIVFYVALNVLSLVTFQLFNARPLETVLTYVFLMSLIIFLFEARVTRIVCMVIVLLRIAQYTLTIHSTNVAADMPVHTDNPVAYLVYDILMLFLLTFVFTLYGWKLYYSDNVRRQKTLFSQHMSHDLQGALKSLTSTIGVLKYEKDNKGKVDSALIDEVADAANFCEFISGNFLDYLRQEKSIASLAVDRFDLASALNALSEVYKYEAKSKNVRIELKVDDRTPTLIYSDKVKVIRIAMNLLTNAINHSEADKSIIMKVSWSDHAWELTVINEGPYIPEEDIPKLFTPFENSNSRSGNKRLGLGLPIAKQLTEALGGRITAKSRERGPTIFTVVFPNYRNRSKVKEKKDL